jgi:hypothetical protein
MSRIDARHAGVIAGAALTLAALAPSCANGVDEATSASEISTSPEGGKKDMKLPSQEVCGNGVDDDGDGLVDEGCGCIDGGSSNTPEFQTGCNSNCVPENTFEEKCSDGLDDDCDGKVDCDDPDCRQPAACGCAASETQCGDGQDDDCDGQVDCDDSDCRVPGSCNCTASETQCGDGQDDDCDGKSDCEDEDCQGCTPGSVRYCADPGFCALGQQTCGPSRQWGACSETVAGGCYGEGLSPEVVQCCINNGYCCQDANNHSFGNCAGIDECNQPAGSE